MLSSMYLKVILLVTIQLISIVVTREVYNYGWPSMYSHEDTVSRSEVEKVLTDALEREKLRLSVDQIFCERPQEVPSCPSTHFIYDPTAKKCSRPYTQGYCPGNMSFVPVPDTKDLGACACTSSACYGRPQVLADNNQCYVIATQGPCDDGETIVPVSKFQTECGPDVCLYRHPENAFHMSDGSKQQPDEYPIFEFTYKGRCYRTESEAFCGRGQVVRFVVPYKIPICVDRNEVRCKGLPSSGYSLETAALPDCKPGTPPSLITGKCRPTSGAIYD